MSEDENIGPGDERSPDELMERFKGKSLKSIVVFTVVVHAVVLLGTSVPWLVKTALGKDTSDLSEEERIEIAVAEAMPSLREIAEEHGLNLQDLTSQFAGGAKPAPARTTAEQPAPEPSPGVETNTPKSAIEQDIDAKATGPELPPLDDEDLFK